MTMTFEAKVQITKERVADLLVGALEGGSNYWYQITKFIEPPGELWVSEFDKKHLWHGEPYRHIAYPMTEGGALVIKDIENDDENAETYRLDLIALQKGVQVMSEKYPHHFSDFVNQNDDAETSDVFLQCCLFGEIVYG
jgi:hypothetical protein